MEIIKVTDKHREIVNEFAPKQTIGGISRLQSHDLAKASRQDFQYTGIYGEIAWHEFRYGNTDKLIETLKLKFETLRPLRKGDDGIDDLLHFRNITKKIDVKTTHWKDDEIGRLNLIVPKREYHENTIYVAAYAIGDSRQSPDHIILAGWANNERVIQIWRDDEPDKRCVPVSELRKMNVLKQCWQNDS